MAGNRKKAEAVLLEEIGSLDPSGKNVELYQKLFKSMTDKDFDEWMIKLKNKEFTVSIIVPNGSKDVKITLERNRTIAKRLGIHIFDRVIFTDDNGVKYMPPQKFNILRLPVRRSSQHITKGISVAEDSHTRNAITGQVTGKSSASSLTLPEQYIINGQGLKETLDELVKVRGGDVKASLGMKARLLMNGTVSKQDLEVFRNRTQSSATLKAIFKAMHIDINI